MWKSSIWREGKRHSPCHPDWFLQSRSQSLFWFLQLLPGNRPGSMSLYKPSYILAFCRTARPVHRIFLPPVWSAFRRLVQAPSDKNVAQFKVIVSHQIVADLQRIRRRLPWLGWVWRWGYVHFVWLSQKHWITCLAKFGLASYHRRYIYMLLGC